MCIMYVMYVKNIAKFLIHEIIFAFIMQNKLLRYFEFK